ncbi:Prion-inhibition and propagation domain containing protein [Hyaloscypha variabilis]
MSGAAEGIAGLALSAISVAALFTTCIECFDIVVAGKNFSEDYEQLCALFSLQRARFGLWGECVGLVPNPGGRRLRYDKNLDRPDIRPGVERILNNIKSLLEEAGKVDERYGLSSNIPQGSEVSNSKGLDIFKGSFERFKSRIRNHQKETSAWKVTRWAIHDAEKFEGMLNRLKDFVDGLESITRSLGLLREQHERLWREIESISDTQSLRLLRDASSRHGSSQHEVSDAASQRLITVAESFIDTQTGDSSFHFPASTDSFVTARSRPSRNSGSLLEDGHHIPGAWPGSVKSSFQARGHRSSTLHSRPKGVHKPRASCQQCLEEHYKCVPTAEDGPCSRCVQTQKDCSLILVATEGHAESAMEPPYTDSGTTLAPESLSTQGLPQHQRLLSDLLNKAKPRQPLSFAAGDAHYGERLAPIKNQDENYWLDNSGRILGQANSGSSAAKRMFFELRNIRAGKVPFVSAVPLDDNLAKILASIEGPPETPYEGGVFFITVKLSESDPFGPPLMRFNTKIYHPNISPQGHICADYKEKWNAVLSAGISKLPVSDAKALWYPPKSDDARWSLGALLTALCGLLASPDVDDPLVPEIAQKYLEDYDEYCENAKFYTQRYATGPRPEYQELIFSEDSSHGSVEPNSVSSTISHFGSTNDVMSLPETTSLSIEAPIEGQPSAEEYRARGQFPPNIDDSESIISASGINFAEGDSPLEVNTLHHFMNGLILARLWKFQTRDRIETSPQKESGIATFSERALFFDLIRTTRNQLKSLNFNGEVTNLKVCHALLEAAQRYLDYGLGHYFNPYDHLEVSNFYTKARELCGTFLADYLINSEIKVQVISQYAFRISILSTPVHEGFEEWNCTRGLDQIKDFNAFLITGLTDARLWGWGEVLDELVDPFSTGFTALLENGLTQTFRSHTLQLLNKEEPLLFIRPNWIKVWANGVPAFIMLKESTISNVEMKWQAKWDRDEVSGDFLDLARIAKWVSNSCLEFHYYYPRTEQEGLTPPASLVLDFSTVEQADLCFETFQALCRIETKLAFPVRPKRPQHAIWVDHSTGLAEMSEHG